MIMADDTQEIRELLCQKCGRDYPVWFTDNELWNRITPEDVHFLCMDCFAVMAEEQGIIPTAWYITQETRLQTEDMRRLNWLENRGRVKARKYGDMKDDWKWDCTSSHTLRESIDIELNAQTATAGLSRVYSKEELGWVIREDPEGFAITRAGEDFMGWFATRVLAEQGLRAIQNGEFLPSVLRRIGESKGPKLS